MSKENITKSDCNLAPTFVDHHVSPDINFNWHCLINNNISIARKVINLYSTYTLNPWLRNLNTDLMLKNCLFGSVKLTKNADPDKYKYSDPGKWFNSRLEFLFRKRSMGKNVIIFRADIRSSVHVYKKMKMSLFLVKEQYKYWMILY